MRWLVVLAIVACHGGSSAGEPRQRGETSDGAVPPSRPPASLAHGCAPGVPAAACAQRAGLVWCSAGATRVGEWRYALIGALYDPVEDMTRDELVAAWRDGRIGASPETAAALATVLGAGTPPPLAARPQLDSSHRAIVSADQLVPAWKVITVGGAHPLEQPATGALDVPLCGPAGPGRVTNIDPGKLTTIAMTGTTAPTRYIALLMEQKGVTYPVRDVEPWLRGADFVHVSNEVSFVPSCDTGTGKRTMSFCARESYIALLEAAHTKIVELTGSHLSDYGRQWIDHSLELYRARGWLTFGGGHDQIDATTPRTLEHHGNQVAFLGCNMVHTTSRTITNGPDVAACDLARMAWQVRDLRSRGIVPIVSIQHEEVYHHDPPDALLGDFRRLAAAGAAFVMGSQAHCAHPWEIHAGAYIHYGPGNLFFDQGWAPVRDAAADRLYIHAGRLLTIGHLYTRIEERGRPRPMTPAERTELLARLARAAARLRGAKPDATPDPAASPRERPESILVGKQQHAFTVTVPATLSAGARYPLIFDGARDDAFVVHTKERALAPQIRAFMRSKYPIDDRPPAR